MIKSLVLLAAALAAAPANAQTAPSRTVSYAGLDLADPAGRSELDRRIAHAVEAICPEAPLWDLGARRAMLACRAAARASVATQREQAIAARSDTAVLRVAAAH